MSGIVCAIRGGPASSSTTKKSIQLAADTGLLLYFLYVVNLDFLSRTESSRVQAVSKELHEMGEFILLTAQEETNNHNIQAKAIVRQGKVSEQIIKLCQELNADYVVLGKPRGHEKNDVFDHEQIKQFSHRIQSECGVNVVFAEIENQNE